MKENGFTLKEVRSSINDADYADDLVLLTTFPAKAEPLHNSLE